MSFLLFFYNWKRYTSFCLLVHLSTQNFHEAKKEGQMKTLILWHIECYYRNEDRMDSFFKKNAAQIFPISLSLFGQRMKSRQMYFTNDFFWNLFLKMIIAGTGSFFHLPFDHPCNLFEPFNELSWAVPFQQFHFSIYIITLQ